MTDRWGGRLSLLLLLLALPGAATAGQDAAALYAAECAFCHGASGGGDGQTSGMLKPPPTAFSSAAYWKTADRAKLAGFITNGKAGTGMMAFGGRLSAQDIEALVAYIETLSQ